MKREGIGIPYPTQTAPANFDTSEHCCEVLTEYMINGEALYLRSHTNQVWGVEAGRDSRVYR